MDFATAIDIAQKCATSEECIDWNERLSALNTSRRWQRQISIISTNPRFCPDFCRGEKMKRRKKRVMKTQTFVAKHQNNAISDNMWLYVLMIAPQPQIFRIFQKLRMNVSFIAVSTWVQSECVCVARTFRRNLMWHCLFAFDEIPQSAFVSKSWTILSSSTICFVADNGMLWWKLVSAAKKKFFSTASLMWFMAADFN